MITWFREHISEFDFNLGQLYKASGISRQYYHKVYNQKESELLLDNRIKEAVLELREDHPRMGARVLFDKLNLSGIIGINRFENYLSTEGLSVKVKRNKFKTTNSNHRWRKYDNLLNNGLKLTGVNQVWASDITYFIIADKVYYITFIEDIYSRRILGCSANENMLAENNIDVLKQSLKLRDNADLTELIHHSDKGSQYCSSAYIQLLEKNNIKISMAQNSIENPYVERLNGILKNDYLYPRNRVTNLKSLRKEMDYVANLYNNEKPHSQLDGMTPVEFEKDLQNKGGVGKVMELYNFKN